MNKSKKFTSVKKLEVEVEIMTECADGNDNNWTRNLPRIKNCVTKSKI